MSRLLLALAILVLAGLGFAAEPVPSKNYLTGGQFRLPEKLQKQLDHDADLIRLGYNPERLLISRISPVHFVEGVLDMTDATRRGSIPGGVYLADSFIGDCMPVAIGNFMTDPEPHPTDWSTMYELGSLTGPIVVTPLILMLSDAGRLSLDDRCGAFVKEFDGFPMGAVTVRQLLQHTSGMPSTCPIPMDVRSRGQLLEYLRRVPLTSKPGTHVEQSGLNFLVLGLVVESVTGEPVQDAAWKLFMEPLGMVNTSVKLPVQWRQTCAPASYSSWHGRLVWGEAAEPSAYILGPAAGNGGLVTTADDLALFSRFMISAFNDGVEDFVTTRTLQLSLEPVKTQGEGATQGIGWALGGIGEGSFGWDGDGGSSLWIHPRLGVFVIILSNQNHPSGRLNPAADPRPAMLGHMEQFLMMIGPQACCPAQHQHAST